MSETQKISTTYTSHSTENMYREPKSGFVNSPSCRGVLQCGEPSITPAALDPYPTTITCVVCGSRLIAEDQHSETGKNDVPSQPSRKNQKRKMSQLGNDEGVLPAASSSCKSYSSKHIRQNEEFLTSVLMEWQRRTSLKLEWLKKAKAAGGGSRNDDAVAGSSSVSSLKKCMEEVLFQEFPDVTGDNQLAAIRFFQNEELARESWMTLNGAGRQLLVENNFVG